MVGEDDMFAMFLYSNITWSIGNSTDRALVGYTTADRKHLYEHPWSLTEDIIKITNFSNVGVPGEWIFHLAEG